MLTIHELPHIMREIVNDLESLNCGIPNLVLRESVQPLQGRLDVAISEKFLCKFDCVALSMLLCQRERRSLDLRSWSSFVTKASVESSSTIIFTTISTITGVRGIRVYTPRRLTNCSIDSSKSTSVSPLDITPFAAWFIWMSQRYVYMNRQTAHTPSRTARPACTAFAGGNNVYKGSVRNEKLAINASSF